MSSLSSDPRYADVIPIPQDDGPHPVVNIFYTSECMRLIIGNSPAVEEIMNYFRAFLQSGELSKRALLLTELVIKVNPANYTAWYFRRQCLDAEPASWDQELAYITEIAAVSPKNYQLWHHRRCVLQKCKDFKGEFSHTKSVLEEDSKNYHVWAHRQWVVKYFNVWDQEIPFINALIEADPRNNSAWNHRFFVVENHFGFAPEAVTREVEYTLKWIVAIPNNESPWNFLTGLLDHCKEDGKIIERVEQCALDLASSGSCVYAMSLLVDLYEEGDQSQRAKAKEVCSRASMILTFQWCRVLAEEADVVRGRYWKLRSRNTSILDD